MIAEIAILSSMHGLRTASRVEHVSRTGEDQQCKGRIPRDCAVPGITLRQTPRVGMKRSKGSRNIQNVKLEFRKQR